jgi:hypothetical protein
MLDGAELRRAAEFLQDHQKNLASSLTDTGQSPASFYARHNQQPNNLQETHSAPPFAIPQPTNLADLPRRD